MNPEVLTLCLRNFDFLIIMLIIPKCYIERHGNRSLILKNKSKKPEFKIPIGTSDRKNYYIFQYFAVLAQWLLYI